MASARSRIVERVALVVLAVAAVAVLGALLWPLSISRRAVEQRVRFRLRRLGLAVNYWVEDHGRRHFPKIVNPAPRTPWQPGRTGSAAVVLRPYLGGDIPPRRREGESEAEFLARLREKELTVDPRTGFEFLYNPLLRSTDPVAVARGDREVRYFTCQDTAEGDPPYTHDGRPGAWSVYGQGQQTQVTEAVLRCERRRLDALEERYAALPPEEWEEDLGHQRRQLTRLEEAFRAGAAGDEGARSLTLSRLEAVVRFDPRGTGTPGGER